MKDTTHEIPSGPRRSNQIRVIIRHDERIVATCDHPDKRVRGRAVRQIRRIHKP